MNKGIAHILLLLIVVGVVLFSPIPSYSPRKTNCLLVETCPGSGFNWKPSLFQQLTTSSVLVIDDFKKPLREMELERLALTSDWKIFTEEEFGFQLQYPSDWEIKETKQILTEENQKSYILTKIGENVPKITLITSSLDSWNQHTETGYDIYKVNGTINNVPAMITIRQKADS